MSRYISRDPFARTELHRETIPAYGNRSCDWCGNLNRAGKLFTYRTESDGGRKSEHRGAFCSKSCHDSYHS
jgi:hypothetical protein